MSEQQQVATKAITTLVKRIAEDGKLDWLEVMRIWTSQTEPKLTAVIDRFVHDAQTNTAAASIVILMATAFEAGRALQVSHLLHQTHTQLGAGLSVGPRAVPAVVALPATPVELELKQDQAYDEDDYNRFIKAGGKVNRGKHRVYLIRSHPQPTSP